MAERVYYLHRLPGSPEPYLLVARDGTRATELFAPGIGWLDMPALAGRIRDAEPIAPERARRLEKSGFGPDLTADELAALAARRDVQ